MAEHEVEEVVSEATEEFEEPFEPTVRWSIPQHLDQVAFVGRDVMAIGHDLYITCFNFKTNTESVYVANNDEKGDGVNCIAGHRANVFAFTEKKNHARIFLISYPAFQILNILQDPVVNRYKGLCMMESDLVCGFSGFPHYVISLWSWRNGQRLLEAPTGVVRRNQIYMASRSHMLVCECWGEGLIVWEVAQCYKKCLIMKRVKEEMTGWEISDPKLVGVCWSNEGQLYSIDSSANLYSINSDGINLVAELEWSDNLSGQHDARVCSFGNGLLVYGPDQYLRVLRKADKAWQVAQSYEPRDAILRLVSNAAADVAAMWGSRGLVYRITAEPDDTIDVQIVAFKQRNVKRVQIIAPDFDYVAMLDESGCLCIYNMDTFALVAMKYVEGADVSFQASPADPLLAIFGEVGSNYGLGLLAFRRDPEPGLQALGSYALTHQIVSRVVFSADGRKMAAAAMAAGHVFIFQIGDKFKLELVRYTELGRGLADCLLTPVGDSVRCFSLVLFSDKYAIGERVVCINAETGKDNKFAGKMQGPYAQLLPLAARDTVLAVPHHSRQLHLLRLSGDKGVTVQVKMGPIIESGHDIRCFSGFFSPAALLTFGYDGTVVLRAPDAPPEYELKIPVSHRYRNGLRQAVVDGAGRWAVTLAQGRDVVARGLARGAPGGAEVALRPPELSWLDAEKHCVKIIDRDQKNYLELLEEEKVREETADYKEQRDEILRTFHSLRAQLLALLEENIQEVPLHQLSLSEFNLHLENKKKRLAQAEKERELIRLETEARIRAQDKVTAWIKRTCWDTMLTPRIKLFAIFSHYQVENYAVLPSQRDEWPELAQALSLRALEMENDGDVFRPWLHPDGLKESPSEAVVVLPDAQSILSVRSQHKSLEVPPAGSEDSTRGEPHILSGTNAHKFITIPAAMIPQTLAFSFLQMDWLCELVKLNVQNMRLWFNQQFDELMVLKRREVGLVLDRNDRLRFIVSELNKLSDLRGSFHHLLIQIRDPAWRQEEEPMRLVTVDPDECSTPPYVSPSQIAAPAPEPGPPSDFRERALLDMMDGVLEKLWHEEIKKPVPRPQCMLDKEPEQFTEDDLRLVFEYEARVQQRAEERDKYRKMLHAEYAKLAGVLNEGVVKFNSKVKELWLTKLRVDSVVGQETLNLMRLRRANLDRLEMAEKLEDMRQQSASWSRSLEALGAELGALQAAGAECGALLAALAQRERALDRACKAALADRAPVVLDQCFRYYKKRPKWQQRASLVPAVLNELAAAILAGTKPDTLHPDCHDYIKAVEQLDQISNMPPVMDAGLWAAMVKQRRVKIENEIRIRALVLETAYVDSATGVWSKSIAARRAALARLHGDMARHRGDTEQQARNKTIQLVIPAGQVEISTTGHMEDFEDAVLMPREDVELINNIILQVGATKLQMMRKQMEFRRGILAKEWEHAQMKMKLRHMEQELSSYRKLKLPKELQLYLKNQALGYTDEMDYVRMEKEMEASKASGGRLLAEHVQHYEELELKCKQLEGRGARLERQVAALNLQVSEKRLREDPFLPIRIRRLYKQRMEVLVLRSMLIRQVQDNHTQIVILQTQLELLRLKTYPTLASFRTL